MLYRAASWASGASVIGGGCGPGAKGQRARGWQALPAGPWVPGAWPPPVLVVSLCQHAGESVCPHWGMGLKDRRRVQGTRPPLATVYMCIYPDNYSSTSATPCHRSRSARLPSPSPAPCPEFA